LRPVKSINSYNVDLETWEVDKLIPQKKTRSA